MTFAALDESTSSQEGSLASPQVWPGGDRARRMTAGSGRKLLPLLDGLYPPGSCLRTLLVFCLSTRAWNSSVCVLSWKAKATPFNRLLFQLAVSMPLTGETGSGLWQTPNVPLGGRVNPVEMSPTGKLSNGKKRQVGLEHQVRMVETGLWPTPRATDRGGRGDLIQAVRENPNSHYRLWPTPQASPNQNRDTKPKPSAIEGTHGWSLAGAVHDSLSVTPHRLWPTPAERDYRFPNKTPFQERGGGKKGEQLPNAVGGALNPEWVAWLQGYPTGWLS